VRIKKLNAAQPQEKVVERKRFWVKKRIMLGEVWVGCDFFRGVGMDEMHQSGWKKLSLDVRTRKSRHVEKDLCEERDTLEEKMHARSGSISLEGIHVRGSAAALQNGCDVKKGFRSKRGVDESHRGGRGFSMDRGITKYLTCARGFGSGGWGASMKSELERIRFLFNELEWNAQGRKKFECQHQSQKSSHMEKGLGLKNGILR
jgi:hypothetical protein